MVTTRESVETQRPDPESEVPTLLRGTWRYLGGIPDWHHWGELEKQSDFAVSQESLQVRRRGTVVTIALSAIEAVMLDCRWSRPRFLMKFVHDSTPRVAVFEFHQMFRPSKTGERLLSTLLELGVKPDMGLAGLEGGGTSAGQAPVGAQSWNRPQGSAATTHFQSNPTQQYSNWMTGPLAAYRPNASPIIVRLQGFAIGFFLSIIGVIAVAVLSDPRKAGDRLVGALGGMVVWVGLLWVMGSFDPWLANYGLNSHDCYQVYDGFANTGITCTGPWSPQ